MGSFRRQLDCADGPLQSPLSSAQGYAGGDAKESCSLDCGEEAEFE
jgi:hypothetical protein